MHLHNVKVLRLAPRHKPLTTLADIFRADLVYFDWMRIEHSWPMQWYDRAKVNKRTWFLLKIFAPTKEQCVLYVPSK